MKMHLSFKHADPKIDPAAYPLIGQIIVRWARFEHLLDFDLRAMLTLPQFKKRRLLKPFTKRIELWLELNEEHYRQSPDHLSIARQMHEAACAAAERRNVLTHGYWGEFDDTEPGAFVFVTIKELQQKMLLTRHDVTVEGLENLNSNISAIFKLHADYLLHRVQEGSIPTDGRSFPIKRTPKRGE